MPFRVFPFRGPQSTSSIESFRDHKFRKEKCGFRLTIGNDGWGRTQHPFDTLKGLTDRKLFGEELKQELLHTVSRQLRIAYSTEQLPNPNNRVMLSDQQDDFGTPMISVL
jgi:glucose dehydrogenase